MAGDERASIQYHNALSESGGIFDKTLRCRQPMHSDSGRIRAGRRIAQVFQAIVFVCANGAHVAGRHSPIAPTGRQRARK
ncbi:hypothetical protein ACLEC2_07780 [Lonsdalea quercina]|uniref:hypothetical protein n=1 Tax=Lonsdalea quercina TaxID=71657 RepID=UPI00056D868E